MIHILTNTYQVIDPFFGRSSRPVELDMGCGKGKLTLELAKRYPGRLVLGSDVMLGRLRRIAAKAERRKLGNVELLRADNKSVAAFLLPDSCVDRIHILCPDPWPKPRHRPRRLITSDFLTRTARILKPGGILHVSTDHLPYFDTMRQVIEGLPFYQRDDALIDDISDVKTDFEQLWMKHGKRVPHAGYRLIRKPCEPR